jgi:DNA-binding FrmR family transcriptional regulator
MAKNQEQPNNTTESSAQGSDAEMEACCCHSKTKQRSQEEYKDLIHRLNRIEGQIRGIKGMVERDAYCPDILVQVAAARAALNSFNKVLLGNHMRTCVVRDIKEGREETVDELLETLQKLMK